MRRFWILSVFLVALLVTAALMAGCGGEGTTPGENGGEITEGSGGSGGGPVSQAEAASCAANRKMISSAAQQYYAMEGTYPTSIQTLVPDFLMTLPACPSGGRYTLQGSSVTCSVHGS